MLNARMKLKLIMVYSVAWLAILTGTAASTNEPSMLAGRRSSATCAPEAHSDSPRSPDRTLSQRRVVVRRLRISIGRFRESKTNIVRLGVSGITNLALGGCYGGTADS